MRGRGVRRRQGERESGRLAERGVREGERERGREGRG